MRSRNGPSPQRGAVASHVTLPKQGGAQGPDPPGQWGIGAEPRGELQSFQSSPTRLQLSSAPMAQPRPPLPVVRVAYPTGRRCLPSKPLQCSGTTVLPFMRKHLPFDHLQGLYEDANREHAQMLGEQLIL